MLQPAKKVRQGGDERRREEQLLDPAFFRREICQYLHASRLTGCRVILTYVLTVVISNGISYGPGRIQ